MELLHALQKSAPQLELNAEDLGDLGPEALQFVRTCGIPGMKVMVFAFDPVGRAPTSPTTATGTPSSILAPMTPRPSSSG